VCYFLLIDPILWYAARQGSDHLFSPIDTLQPASFQANANLLRDEHFFVFLRAAKHRVPASDCYIDLSGSTNVKDSLCI
jgi:hypothetical protein